MTAPSRTSQFNKLHKVLKRHYKPVVPDSDRGVLEHLLFACCVENAHYDAAQQAFMALVHNFFDWNEVRVSSVRELAEAMHGLPDPPMAAHRVKRVLQSLFEATYDFALEDLRKLNLGPASERLVKIDGTTNFSVAYVIQAALGGHAIPVDAGTLRALHTVDLVTDEDVKAGVVPGLERAVSKSKGVEFASLLHQLGADFSANPYTAALKGILTEIDSEAATRLPKRRARREGETPVQRRHRRTAAKRAKRVKQAEQQKRSAEEEPPKKPEGKEGAEGVAAAGKKKGAAKPKKKSAAAQKKSSGKKKGAANPSPEKEGDKNGADSAGLSKRKPR